MALLFDAVAQSMTVIPLRRIEVDLETRSETTGDAFVPEARRVHIANTGREIEINAWNAGVPHFGDQGRAAPGFIFVRLLTCWHSDRRRERNHDRQHNHEEVPRDQPEGSHRGLRSGRNSYVGLRHGSSRRHIRPHVCHPRIDQCCGRYSHRHGLVCHHSHVGRRHSGSRHDNHHDPHHHDNRHDSHPDVEDSLRDDHHIDHGSHLGVGLGSHLLKVNTMLSQSDSMTYHAWEGQSTSPEWECEDGHDGLSRCSGCDPR